MFSGSPLWLRYLCRAEWLHETEASQLRSSAADRLSCWRGIVFVWNELQCRSIRVAGWAQHKGNTFQNSEQEKQHFKGWWICPPLWNKWKLEDHDRNVLKTVGRQTRVKQVTLESQFQEGHFQFGDLISRKSLIEDACPFGCPVVPETFLKEITIQTSLDL